MQKQISNYTRIALGLLMVSMLIGPSSVVSLAQHDSGRQTTAEPSTLPPIPTGLPLYFSFGLFNQDTNWITGSGIPWDFRYQYLSGGVNTGDGWATWNSPPGQYALNYIAASRAANLIPGFIY